MNDRIGLVYHDSDAQEGEGRRVARFRRSAMARLKADLHAHCADDGRDQLDYSAEMLIDAVAQLNLDVLAITGHEAVTYSEQLSTYARERGVLLVPGMEALIDGKHVILLNPDTEQAAARTFDELRKLGRRDAAILAPHPFYPIRASLGRVLAKHIDLFDAVEYCALYFRGVNPNRAAERVAKRNGLPMVGTSDAHRLPYDGSTFSWIDAEPTVEGVIQAIRDGRVECVTHPRPMSQALMLAGRIAWGMATRGEDEE